MRVTTKRTEEEIRKEFFGPLKEAANSTYSLDINPTESWCELAELRLVQLIIQFKPVGVNRQFNLAALVDRMARVYDNEVGQVDIFLSEQNKIRFRNQQRDLITSISNDVSKRMSFPTKFACRPTLDQIKAKIEEMYDLKLIEKNEGYPDQFEVDSEFFLPDGEYSEMMRKKEERSTSVASNASKKRKLPTPDN